MDMKTKVNSPTKSTQTANTMQVDKKKQKNNKNLPHSFDYL